MSRKVLITPRSLTRDGHPELARFTDAGYEVITCTPGRQPSEEELIELLPGCVGMLAGVERISARALGAAGDLKVIGRNGVGTDNIDLQAAEKLGIIICLAVGANSRGVAELAISLMLALARSVPFSDASLKAGRWERRKGIELSGRELGLIGCGQIGKHVARIALGLEMKVIAHDPFRDDAFRPGEAFRYAGLDEVLGESDVISLHCPAPADGRPLIDGEAIDRMKRGAYLVNTARAALVDERAVLAALNDGRLAGLATDVFSEEPPGCAALVGHDRVVATPHVGGYTAQSVDRAVTVAVGMMLECLGR